ncbi:hypothetical protein BEN47_07405 [Hymenobacter lapidarius]|uniref:Uncharacterized protein n=1 Tax=Hymenobacter lapidarius TaxID=1908237 RepID=A0A1G1TEC0_9BACT|nr:hypothetical protein [Hymenobacter lapidarius]OGX89223.1 hypothetical protein BEN47_07405 [Hymenobacter lapidarius]
MRQPQFPLIAIGNNGVPNIIQSASVLSKASVRELTTAYFDTVDLFDNTSVKWKFRQVSANLKISWWTKSLANTIYNPTLDVDIVWTFNGAYHLSELKKKLTNCVDKDDDIITQFEEADVIKAAIGNAMQFDDILIVLNKYVFDVYEEQIWKDQEA